MTNLSNEIERVAAVLRRLKDTPDALVFVDDGGEVTWDSETICGLPVFHASELAVKLLNYSDGNCPWLPIYKDQRETDGWRFSRLYSEEP